jgi:hypothetical protein
MSIDIGHVLTTMNNTNRGVLNNATDAPRHVTTNKRAVVVGDDRQLSFIPQIGQAQDKNLMQAQGLPITKMARYAQSKRSLFDFALRISETPRVLLRHQYRSAAPIVDYISKEYYGGKLTTSYDPTSLVVPKSQKAGLAWTHVSGPTVPEKGNVNRKEASAITDHLKKLLVDQSYQGSVGVIAPFRSQVHVLEDTIRSSLPEQKLAGADLKVATVDGFQGQERDLILFSPCLGTWTDFVVLAIVLALDDLEESELIAQSPITWKSEATLGRWFDQDRPLAVFWLKETGRIVEVQSRPIKPGHLQTLSRAHISLRITDPSRVEIPRRIAVWTPHSLAAINLEKSVKDANELLRQIQKVNANEILRNGLIIAPAYYAPEEFSVVGERTRVDGISFDAAGSSLGFGLKTLAKFARSKIYQDD